MMRLIFLLIAIYFVFKVVQNLLKGWLTSVFPSARPAKGGKDQTENLPTVLISCPVCGTYFQEKQGFVQGGLLYCSQRCASQKK